MSKKISKNEFLNILIETARAFSVEDRISVDITSALASEGLCLVIQGIECAEDISWGVINDKLSASGAEGFDSVLFKNCTFKRFFTEGNPSYKHGCKVIQLGFHDCKLERLDINNHHIREVGFLNTFIKNLRLGNVFKSNFTFIGGTTIENFRSMGVVESSRIVKASFNFRNVKFTNVFSLSYLEFLGSLFFINCQFNKSPNFISADLNSSIEFNNCNFKSFDDGSILNYRYLKEHFRKSGNYHMTDIFSSYEMRAWAENDSLDWSEKILAKLYQHFSNYGKDLSRSVICYFLFFLAFLLIFSIIDIFVTDIFVLEITEKTPIWLEHLFIENTSWIVQLNLILIKTVKLWLGPFGLLINTEGIEFSEMRYAFMAWLLQTISSVMLFLILLAIRRRYRLN